MNYLKLCVDSIRKNSSFEHQIIIHVNEGADGTLDWVKEQRLDFTYSKINVGVCLSLNKMRTLVQTDYILYMNDDMYVCPEWDKYLWEDIQSRPDHLFFISSTMIQPSNSKNNCIITNADYGRTVESFDEQRLLKEYDTYKLSDWHGATWPPNIVHKSVWDMVGGYSIEYTPGMYSDPDFTAKLKFIGVDYFKGVAASRVYHFECRSTKRIKKNKGSAQFLLKWGITSAAFMRAIIRRGDPFTEEDYDDTSKPSMNVTVMRGRAKSLLYIMRNFNKRQIW